MSVRYWRVVWREADRDEFLSAVVSAGTPATAEKLVISKYWPPLTVYFNGEPKSLDRTIVSVSPAPPPSRVPEAYVPSSSSPGERRNG